MKQQMKRPKSLIANVRDVITRDDRGENSIMQVISIAVSAILIVAGLVTAPSLIQSARNTNAANDLANIAYVEEYANSNSGGYIALSDQAGYAALTAATADDVSGTGSKLTLTSGGVVGVALSSAHGGYIAVVGTASPAGVPRKWFARTGSSTKVVPVTTTAGANPTLTQIQTAVGGTVPTGSFASFYTVP